MTAAARLPAGRALSAAPGSHRARRVIRTLGVAVTVSFVLGWTLPRTPFAQPVVQSKGVTPPASTPIPVPEVAQRAEEAAALLRQVVEHLATDRTASDVETRLPRAAEWVTARLSSTHATLAASNSPGALANLTDSWTLMRSQLAAWNELLARRATQLERELGRLESVRATWSVSRDAALASRAPAPVLVGLPRGLPYALSSLTHYVVVFLGLMLGLAALAADTSRRPTRSTSLRRAATTASRCRKLSRLRRRDRWSCQNEPLALVGVRSLRAVLNIEDTIGHCERPAP